MSPTKEPFSSYLKYPRLLFLSVHNAILLEDLELVDAIPEPSLALSQVGVCDSGIWALLSSPHHIPVSLNNAYLVHCTGATSLFTA